jgi:3',5'-cyclic AMP phosphodiesterase CpdA
VTVLLQVSDTHFGTEQAPVVDALITLSAAQRPDLLVLSGDITQRARRAQFCSARDFVRRLGAPLLAIPGNHDLPLFDLVSRLHRPYARYREAFGDDLEPVHSSPDLLVVGVNTTRWYRHENGEVSERQIARVAASLANATAGQLRVVVVHQPVAVPGADDVHNLLRGRSAALQRWAAAGADLVMGGHIHLPCVIALPGLARPMWAVQAGTAVSWRVRDGQPNSVNLLRWGHGAPVGRCLIEQWDFDALTGCFGQVASTDLQPARTTP